MTRDMMHAATTNELAALNHLTKRELIAYANNQICILVNNADLIVAGNLNPEQVLDSAVTIARCGRKFAAELEELFKTPVDAHIGSVQP